MSLRDAKRLDINRTDELALVSFVGISPHIAHLIIVHRERNGPFGAWEEVEAIPGVNRETMDRLKARATLQPPFMTR